MSPCATRRSISTCPRSRRARRDNVARPRSAAFISSCSRFIAAPPAYRRIRACVRPATRCARSSMPSRYRATIHAMEFSWTAEQNRLYLQAREFAEQRVSPAVAARSGAPYFGEDEWRLCGELGLLGCCIPERYGGRGRDALTVARVV